MDFNIALNTIIYLMIFLFPGLLFRKFYFISAHTKQFNNGNLFERSIWTILLSIAILIFSTALFIFLKSTLNLPLLESLSYQSIKGIFNTLSLNQLPDKKDVSSSYKDFFIFIMAVYLLSWILGILAYLINSKIYPFFKFNNYWEGLVKGTYKKKDIRVDLVYGYTQADVLTQTLTDSKLYSGKVVDYFLSKDNQLETIVITDVNRYKKSDNVVEVKKVPGHNFCIDNKNILNINFTYIYEKKSDNKYYIIFTKIINIIYTLLFFFFVILIFLDLENTFLNSFFKKIIFSICSLIFLSNVKQMLIDSINGEYYKISTVNYLRLIVFLLPTLWLGKLFNGWILISLEILAFFIFGYYIQKNERNKQQS